MRGEEIISGVLALGDHVRYVAVANGQDVELRQRAGLVDASSNDSDRYEELLVNPVLLLLTRLYRRYRKGKFGSKLMARLVLALRDAVHGQATFPFQARRQARQLE